MRLELERHTRPAPDVPRQRSTAASRPARRDVLEWSSYLLLLVVWGLHVLPSRGGWEPYAVTAGTLACLPALLVLRPWRVLPRWLCALAVLPSVGACVVVAVTPFGDGGPVTLGKWGYAGAVLLATAAFARTTERRTGVLAVLLLVALQQFASAWLPWWGGDDGTVRVMTGDLYSANPFGGMMLAFTLVACALVLFGDTPLRRLGWLLAPLTACAVVLSAARAAMLLLAVGLVVLTVLSVRAAGARGAVRAAALVGVMAVVQVASTSRLFFAERGGALASSASKAEVGQTLDSTSGIRLDFWSAAWELFLSRPLTGEGSGSYSGASRELMADAAQRSPFAHNEVLGSLAEGGLVLGLPVALLLLATGFAASRTLWASLRSARVDPTRTAAALGLAGLLLHALVDFPLSFPALLALAAVLAGLLLGDVTGPPSGRVAPYGLAVLVLLPLVIAGGYLAVGHDRAGVGNRAGIDAVEPSGQVLRPELPLLRDARLDVATARALVRADAPDEAVLRSVETRLRPLATVDVSLLALVADVQRTLGQDADGLRTARQVALRARAGAPVLMTTYAEHLAADGRPGEAFDLLAGEAYRRGGATGRLRTALAATLGQALRVSGPREPGWSCAVLKLREAGPVPVELSLSPLSLASLDRCAAWSRHSETLLGDAR